MEMAQPIGSVSYNKDNGSKKCVTKETESDTFSHNSSHFASCENDRKKHHRRKEVTLRLLAMSRFLFLFFLCLVAALLGYGAYRVITSSEEQLTEEHFNAIAGRALDEALKISSRKRLGAKALAAVASFTFPEASTWPNVSMFGFEGIASSIMDTAEAKTMGLCPLVWTDQPDQLAKFEAFAYDTAFPKINDYPNTTGLVDFDGDGVLERGIHGFDLDFQRYRETPNSGTDWNSSYPNVKTPFIMHSAGPPILMFNIHSMERFGAVIDDMLDCAFPHKSNSSRVKEEASGSDASYLNNCSVMSDILVLYKEDGTPNEVSSYIIQPIYPANDKQTLTGFITSSMQWNEVLDSSFSSKVSGVDCVLETGTQVYTFTVKKGEVILKGEGYLQDSDYESYAKSIKLYIPDEGIPLSDESASYKLTIYPNDELFDVYGTDNPIIAMVGSLCIILLVSLLFLLYDHFFQKVLFKKQAVLEAKRRFVRFISHEIRTPINTVCMGSSLLQETISKYDTAFKKSLGNPTIPGSNLNNQLQQQENNHQQLQENNPHSILNLREQLKDWADVTSDILVNANSAVNVLGDLLNYDKVDSGTLPLEFTIIPIIKLVQRVSSEFRLAAFAKNIHYGVDYEPVVKVLDDNGTCSYTFNHNINIKKGQEPVASADCETGAAGMECMDLQKQYVVGDTVRVSQVLRNFISNALEFTPTDGDIKIRVSWKQLPSSHGDREKPKKFVLDQGNKVEFFKTGYVQIDVKDSGEGLSQVAAQSVIEDSKFDMDNLESGQGSGLGLYMSKGIAEQHGGRVRVSSKGLGQGSRFTLILPLYEVPESALPDSLRNRRQPGLREVLHEHNCSISEDTDNTENRSYRILVVDDSKVCRKMLMRLLQSKGHECEEAENGARSLEMVKKAIKEGNHYDTILMDYEMPIMKGPEAVKEIRRLGITCFVAGLTGNLLSDDIQCFKRHGADCVLPKPFNMGDLESRWASHGVTNSAVVQH